MQSLKHGVAQEIGAITSNPEQHYVPLNAAV
jgi:hypothetical protein